MFQGGTSERETRGTSNISSEVSNYEYRRYTYHESEVSGQDKRKGTE